MFKKFSLTPSTKFFSIVIATAATTALIVLVGCGLAETRPKLEMELTQAAFVAARDSKANVLAPNLFRQAEVYYLKARSSYKRKYFSKAKQYALLSKQYAEQAEYISIKKGAMEGNK